MSSKFRRTVFGAVSLATVLCFFILTYISQSHITSTELNSQAAMLIDAPAELPPFIAGTNPKAGNIGGFGGQLCFDIWDGPPLDTGSNSYFDLFSHTSLFLDGNRVYAQ